MTSEGGPPDADLWQRVDDLFEQALDLPDLEREAFVLRATAEGSGDVRARVLALLAADRKADNFLERPVSPGPLAHRPAPAPPLEAGSTVGPYRLLEIRGRGGMGTVYRAERRGEFHRTVAVKILHPGLLHPELKRRLQVERQVLAQLEHPCIARLYDGGTTDDGRPWLAMEWVDGEPIDRYCRHHGLDVPARLRLFRQVCDAVDHAHRNLLVHRDLKPANILVTADGTPKLLDFGIAKLLDRGRFHLPAAPTRTGWHPMTPAWASPEQLRGEPVTTASDVYSLGLLLYRLLTGTDPYPSPTDGGAGSSPGARERAMLRTEPAPPSSQAADRDTARRLRGDLDTIVLQALRPEPERRYGSVRELAEDLRRHLEHRPVEARPESFLYRSGKLLRRHRLAAVVTALALLAVTGFSLLAVLQAREVARQRDRVLAQQARAEQVSDFLLDLFRTADPEHARGEELRVREVLDRGVRQLGALDGQPALQATQMTTLGRVHRSLGLYPRAEELLTGALELWQRLEDPRQASARLELARLRRLQGDPEAAEALLRRNLATPSAAGTPERPEVLEELGRALFDQRRYEGAEAVYRDALAATRQASGERHPRVARLLHHLALVHHDRAEVAAAEDHYHQALELTRQLQGEVHPEVASILNNLAFLLREKGDSAAAEPVQRRAVELRERLYGGDHPALARSRSNLARILVELDRFQEAEVLYHQALTSARRSLGDRHPLVPATLERLGMLARERGAAGEAERFFREALELERQLPHTDPLDLANRMDHLAGALEELGRFDQAEALYRESLALDRATLGAGNPWIARSEVFLARLLLRRGRPEAAEALVRGALPRFEAVAEYDVFATARAEAESVLGAALARRGDTGEARELLSRSVRELERRQWATRPALEFARRELEALGAGPLHPGWNAGEPHGR